MNGSIKKKGSYGRVIVAACFGIQAIGIGTFATYGVFFNSFLSEFGWSRSVISGANSVSFLLTGFLGILAGQLNDRIGPRKIMTVTGFFFGLAYLLMSRLDAVWQLYLFYGILFGIGLSSMEIIPLSTTARWYAKKRGVVTGIVKIGVGVGQLTMPMVAGILIASYGWRTAYFIMGTATLISLVAIAQVLRRDPAQMGSSMEDEETKPMDIPDLSFPGLSLRQAIHTKQFWTICAVDLIIVFCIMIVFVHIAPHAQDMGISGILAAGVISTIGGVAIFGTFITGIAIDRMGSKTAMALCLILLTVGLLWLQITHTLWMIYFFAVLFGIALIGFFTTISPLIAEYFGLIAHGVIFGIVGFSGTIGGSVGPVIAGYIFDTTSSYNLIFFLCLFMSAIGLLLILSLKPIKGSVDIAIPNGRRT